MARATALPSLGLSPFGGGSGGFDAFSVTSRSERAYLEFRKVEIQWENGSVDNAAYLAALQAYGAKLKTGSSEKLNAEQKYKDTVYRVNRNAIVQGINTGTKTYADLVEFDQKSIEGMNVDSEEYKSRQNDLFTSQTNDFRTRERDISDAVQAGRMTYTAAMAWYQQQRAGYATSQNADLLKDIDSSISDMQVRVNNEQDQKILDDWGDGKIKIDTLISYAAKVIAAEPDTERAKTWTKNIDDAKKQAIEASLGYRYQLTEEYQDLAAFVAQPPSSGGGGGVTKGSTSVRQVMGADGKWRNVTVTTGAGRPLAGPSAAEQQAYHEWQLKAASAKKRMAEITKMVSGLPGGWVSEDDMVRVIAAQQAGMAKGTPEWLAAQEKIDYYNNRKATDAIMRQSGLRVSLPTARSERQTDTSVSPYERPFAPSAGGATAPRVGGGGSSGGGGGGGGGSTGGGGGSAAGLPAQRPVSNGFLMQITGQARPGQKGNVATVSTLAGQTSVTWKSTGLPKGMNPKEWDVFYGGITKAVREGATTWTDASTGISYLLPADPKSRLAIMSGMDASNVNLKTVTMQAKAGTAGFDSAVKAYNAAIGKANTNTAYVMDTRVPGLPHGAEDAASNQYVKDYRNDAPIATAVEYMDRVETQVKQLGEWAQEAWDRGDYQAAYGYTRAAANVLNGETMQSVVGYANRALGTVAALEAGGATIPKGGDLGGDLARIASIAVGADGKSSWLGGLMNDSGIEKVADQFTSKSSPLLTDAAGMPVIDRTTGEFQLKPGLVRVLQGDKIVAVEAKMQINPRTNKLEPIDPSKVMVSLQVGNTFVPVLSDYTIGTVGVTSDGQAIQGKIVDITYDGQRYQVAQNPFNPSKWLPIDNGGMVFKLPAGTQIVKGSPALGQTGSQIAFTISSPTQGVYGTTGTTTAGGSQTRNYVLALDASTGEYGLYTSDAAGQPLAYVGGAGDANVAAILKQSGIDLDVGALNNDQRAIYWTNLNGAYAGATGRIAQKSDQIWDSTHAGAGYVNDPYRAGRELHDSLMAQQANADPYRAGKEYNQRYQAGVIARTGAPAYRGELGRIDNRTAAQLGAARPKPYSGEVGRIDDRSATQLAAARTPVVAPVVYKGPLGRTPGVAPPKQPVVGQLYQGPIGRITDQSAAQIKKATAKPVAKPKPKVAATKSGGAARRPTPKVTKPPVNPIVYHGPLGR